MLHHYLQDGKSAHWAANTNGFGSVIVQLGDDQCEQLRLKLTPAQAKAFAKKLSDSADAALDEPPLPAPEIAPLAKGQTQRA